MVDLITGPLDPAPDIAAQGASIARPSSLFSDIDPFELSKQVGRSIGNAIATHGMFDDVGNQVSEPEPPVAGDVLKHLEVPDSPDMKGLHFTGALPLSVAESMHDAKQEEIQRASIAGNQSGGFVPFVARQAVGLAAGMLDPLNVAASFMPVVGEARLGAALARSFGEEAGGRLATAFGVGAARGAAGQAPLVALRYGMSQQEQADYTASNAMADLVMGTLLGGGLHTIVEGTHDWLGRRFRGTPEARVVDADPAAREAAMRASVGAVADGRPVDVAAYIRLHEPQPVIDQHLISLGVEEARLRGDRETLDAARQDVPAGATDAATTLSRVEAIDSQLANPELSRVERKALADRKDELLGSTTPEQLQAQAQPAREVRQAANQRAAIDARLQEIAAERDRIRVDATLGHQYVTGDLTSAWRERMAAAQREVANSATVREAAGAPGDTLATSREADAAVAAKPPARPELPPERDPEVAASHLAAAKALLEPPPEAPKPTEDSTGLVAGLGGAGKAIGENLRSMLWDKLQRGDTTELGQPSRVLTAAKAAMDSGTVKTRADFDRFVDDFYKKAPPASEAPAVRGMLTEGERAELEAMNQAQANAEGEAKAFENYGLCIARGITDG